MWAQCSVGCKFVQGQTEGDGCRADSDAHALRQVHLLPGRPSGLPSQGSLHHIRAQKHRCRLLLLLLLLLLPLLRLRPGRMQLVRGVRGGVELGALRDCRSALQVQLLRGVRKGAPRQLQHRVPGRRLHGARALMLRWLLRHAVASLGRMGLHCMLWLLATLRLLCRSPSSTAIRRMQRSTCCHTPARHRRC